MHLAKARILVVDDEPNVLLTVKAILEQECYDVDARGDGIAAIQAIRERHYDLVLTDLKMPGVDGLGVLAEVRKLSPNTVTVMMTGYGSLDSALEAVQLGAYEYLLKPVGVPELKLAVQRSLERKRFSEIDTLYRVHRVITTAQDKSSIVAAVGDAVRTVLGVGNATLVRVAREEARLHDGNTLAGLLQDPAIKQKLASGHIITAEDEHQAASAWAVAAGLRSFALVPGCANGRLVCVLAADHGAEAYEFHPSAQRFLEALAGQAALVLENASLISELRRNNRELAAANEKLRELDKLKSHFLSIATHELRTPLSVILGYNAMLAESLEDRLREDEKETLRESVAACKRLIRLINSMLDISQIESGKMKMNFAPADLRHLVLGVSALFQQEARRKEIRLAVELPSRLPRLHIDAERIEQVLINLVGNALKFTGRGGRVAIAVRQASQAMEVSVSDTGVGIAPADQQKLFDEFAQFRQPGIRRKREGSGLGLAIAKRIVEAHAGDISVCSALRQGSTFTFTLPLRTRRESASTAVSA
jgi:signal transduction histidine kinase